MKVLILSFIIISTTIQAQSILYPEFQNQIEYYKSNGFDDENGNTIFNNSELSSIIFTSDTIKSAFGISVSSAGDVNGDGFSDIIVGASSYNSGTGRAYIFFGGLTMDNIADVTLIGNNILQCAFGSSVSTAGDVNGDGFSDVIVGAGNYVSNTGKAYIYYGGSPMDSIYDKTMTGESIQNHFGSSVSSAGDVNGDGFSDVIVGAFRYNNYTGKAYIYFGGSPMNGVVDITLTGNTTGGYLGYSVSNAGDVNGDGFSDVIIGTYQNNTLAGDAYILLGGTIVDSVVDITLTGNYLGSKFGSTVSSAGDLNGDGFSDVIVGARDTDVNGSNSGQAFIYFGGIFMNNIADLIMTGEDTFNYFGKSVSNAGDVNGDGFSDVIIGAYGYLNNKGRSYLFYGGSSMDTIADITMTGESSQSYFGYSVSTAGDVNHNSYSEIIVGAYNPNNYGKVFLYFNPIPELIYPINNSFNNPLSINFKWRKYNSSSYYVLSIANDSNFNSLLVRDTLINDTSKFINGFQLDTKYFWKVTVKDSLDFIYNSTIWNFTTIPPINLYLTLLFEGIYSTDFNQLRRNDTITAYLRQSNPPYNIIDSAKSIIDSLSFTGLFKFYNTPTGSYYITIRHLNTIETWSKIGGEVIIADGTVYYYDFTTSSSQAYGNNLKLKGSKYCLYSGDINQDGFIDLLDVVPIYNGAKNFITGNYLVTDLTGDGIVDLLDVTLCFNNSGNFIRLRRP